MRTADVEGILADERGQPYDYERRRLSRRRNIMTGKHVNGARSQAHIARAFARLICATLSCLGCSADPRTGVKSYDESTFLPREPSAQLTFDDARFLINADYRDIAGRLARSLGFDRGVRLEMLQPGGTVDLLWLVHTSDGSWVVLWRSDDLEERIEVSLASDVDAAAAMTAARRLANFLSAGHAARSERREVSDAWVTYVTIWDSKVRSYVIHADLQVDAETGDRITQIHQILN